MNDVISYIGSLSETVSKGHGWSLVVVGMVTVFFGLFLLFFNIHILRVIINLYHEGKLFFWQKPAEKIEVKPETIVYHEDLEKTGAAIALALFYYRLKHIQQELTINEKNQQNWKMTHRMHNMNNLKQ